MKPAIWRIFQNGRWSYADQPSTNHLDRPAWQPLYAQLQREWQGLTDEEMRGFGADLLSPDKSLRDVFNAIEAKLKAKNDR